MESNIDKYVNERGDFEFPKFLYSKHNALMKAVLDLGNLACSNPSQLRAFKERVKKDFKSTWSEYAHLLYEFGVVERCVCGPSDFCDRCGGARFVPADMLNADSITENVLMTASSDPEIIRKLQLGLMKAKNEVRSS